MARSEAQGSHSDWREQTPRVSPTPLPNECVLILTPIGKDAENAKYVIEKAGLRSEVCTDLRNLCMNSTEETGVLLIAEEALTSDMTPELLKQLNAQPPWSDIPIVILTSGGEANETNIRVMRLFQNSGNVTLLERPIHALTLISAIQVALRARRRQWEIRELINQRESLLTQSRRAREEAEMANRMKDQFLATLSHELRTPLNAILGWCQVLRDGQNSQDDIDLGLETIDRNARTQAQLIEDLLDISRIISGKLRLDIQHVELPEIIRAALAAVLPAAEAKGIRIHAKVDPSVDSMYCDPARLQQICWNLLSNAVKFTPTNGVIELCAKRDETHVAIIVQDNGIGIDRDFLPFVFDRFRQADGSTTRRQGGLGLGLSIVKQLTELHGGSISVESQGPGTGATFTITLPIREVTLAQTPISTSNPERQKQRRPDKADLHGIDILVVDDEPDSRELLKRILTDQKAEVHVAASVDEALAQIDRKRPDIVISDISMPVRDGFDLIMELRTNGYKSQHIPAVALTAYARTEDRDQILRSGFQAHVPKPIDTSELTHLVVQLVQRDYQHGESPR